ncbi:MAG TPA: hypothetical protein VEF72_17760 [Mycobacterium sp.]|nr:hypothetical protein [Mycobacterium sp.]
MPELLNALHDEQLRNLKGWGETSERNLARAIRRMQEVGGRMPLAIALDVAEDLVARIAALPQVSRVDYAGSLSKKVENLAHAVSLHYINYNFARPHATLIKAAGGYPTTPAMAAGVSHRVWTHRDIAALLD